jgi:hypothetical protein
MKTTATMRELVVALSAVNAEYQGNVTFKSGPSCNGGKWTHFTLRVKSSSGPGHRVTVGSPSRKMIAACWHLHYDFMEHLFNINPDAVLVSAVARYEGRADFEDRAVETAYTNIGSMARPVYLGDACACSGGAS